jgi:hypothetical protein
MLTIIFLSIMVALLVVIGIWAMMAKSNKRRGQSGSPTGGEGAGKQGRASGLD